MVKICQQIRISLGQTRKYMSALKVYQLKTLQNFAKKIELTSHKAELSSSMCRLSKWPPESLTHWQSLEMFIYI